MPLAGWVCGSLRLSDPLSAAKAYKNNNKKNTDLTDRLAPFQRICSHMTKYTCKHNNNRMLVLTHAKNGEKNYILNMQKTPAQKAQLKLCSETVFPFKTTCLETVIQQRWVSVIANWLILTTFSGKTSAVPLISIGQLLKYPCLLPNSCTEESTVLFLQNTLLGKTIFSSQQLFLKIFF